MSLVHFAQHQLVSNKPNQTSGSQPLVCARKDAVPDQSDEEIREQTSGALERLRKAEARCAAWESQAQTEHAGVRALLEKLRAKDNALQSARVGARVSEAQSGRGAGEGIRSGARKREGSIDHAVMKGLRPSTARSICGLPDHDCLEVRTRTAADCPLYVL